MTSSTLLRHGTLLVHDAKDHVIALKADLLVVGNKIAEIGVGISAPSPDTTTIDCTSKIISPGFVDTHHHLFSTPLKGRHGNDLMLDFLPKGEFTLTSGFNVSWSTRYQRLVVHPRRHFLG